MKHMAFDLDDTLINTGATIIRLIEDAGYPVSNYREPYDSLRNLLNTKVISPDDYDLFIRQAADQAEPIEETVVLLKETIATYGVAHIVSTRAYTNTDNTLNILGRILTLDEIFKVQIHWCKAPSEAIQKAVIDQGLGDAKLATFLHVVELGVTHFMDDLMYNIETILEKVPGLVPVLVHQPWVEDRLYVPELIDHPAVDHFYLN